MKYLIVPNYYAPKSPTYQRKFGSDKIHAVSFNQCNFNCAFCGFKQLKKANSYYDYSLEEFDRKVESLIPSGLGFKFTGGEPTLNPRLLDSLQCVKKHGGAVLVDTNGSDYETIKSACDEGLLDVLGISLKGLTPAEAIRVSGVGRQKLCWENVLKSIHYVANNSRADVIVTYVVDSTTDLSALNRFIELLQAEQSVYFKVNNFQESKFTINTGLYPYPSDLVRNTLEHISECHSNLKGRIIFVDSSRGICDTSGIEVI